MKLLGIDFGTAKVGLAVGDTSSRLATPLKVIKHEELKGLIDKMNDAVQSENIEKIVIGISEGVMESKTKEFAESLKSKLKIPVVFQDETLTSLDAQSLSIAASIGRKKRKNLEDAYSAALILQGYLDS